MKLRPFLLPHAHLSVLGIAVTLVLTGCGTTRRLPVYERPLAKTDFQAVRTTAYTHTESDHLEYGNHNALGGTLQPAALPVRSAAVIPRALPVYESGDRGACRPVYIESPAPFSYSPPVYGSAAADWSRWPAGTIFRVLSTGQLYRVDDYGWALAGRNTIDLYMGSVADMNGWGTRQETIQIVSWGEPAESLRLLARHQDHRHIKRMVLELEGHTRAAARLE